MWMFLLFTRASCWLYRANSLLWLSCCVSLKHRIYSRNMLPWRPRRSMQFLLHCPLRFSLASSDQEDSAVWQSSLVLQRERGNTQYGSWSRWKHKMALYMNDCFIFDLKNMFGNTHFLWSVKWYIQHTAIKIIQNDHNFDIIKMQCIESVMFGLKLADLWVITEIRLIVN